MDMAFLRSKILEVLTVYLNMPWLSILSLYESNIIIFIYLYATLLKSQSLR